MGEKYIWLIINVWDHWLNVLAYMLGVNNLMYYIHICMNVLCNFMYSRSSLSRISALGADGGEDFLLLDALRREVLRFWFTRPE